MRVIFMPFWGENAMKVIEYGEKSCQGMLLTSPKKRKTWGKNEIPYPEADLS